MTPAVNIVTNANIRFEIHQYVSAGNSAATDHNWGTEAAVELGSDSARVFKTIVLEIDATQLCVGIVPVAREVDLKALASAAGGKKAALAATDKAQRSSGYVLGGISPLGQRQALPTFLDSSALEFDTIFVSAGKRGLEIELAGTDLLGLTNGQAVAIAR